MLGIIHIDRSSGESQSVSTRIIPLKNISPYESMAKYKEKKVPNKDNK
jgi:hypothetical protein